MRDQILVMDRLLNRMLAIECYTTCSRISCQLLLREWLMWSKLIGCRCRARELGESIWALGHSIGGKRAIRWVWERLTFTTRPLQEDDW